MASVKKLATYQDDSFDLVSNADMEKFGKWLENSAQKILLPLLGGARKNIRTVSIENGDSIFSELWSTSILVSGVDFSFKFLTFFRICKVKNLMHRKVVGKIGSNRQKEFIVDFMKEYCNHTGGFIKSELEKFSIASSISIPIRCRALDMVFSESERLSSIHNFKLEVGADSGFHCQVQMKFGSNFLKTIEPVLNGVDKKDSSDEIEIELF